MIRDTKTSIEGSDIPAIRYAESAQENMKADAILIVTECLNSKDRTPQGRSTAGISNLRKERENLRGILLVKVITNAIIPAAELGIRFLPITIPMPKVMISVVPKCVIHYVVE